MVFSSPLSDLFANSPIKPMQDHAHKVYQSAKMLKPFMEAVFNENWDSASELQLSIHSLENEADDMKRAIRLNLPKGLFMAIDRRDMLDLLSRQDKIANKAKDIAGVIIGRKQSIPGSIQESMLKLTERSVDACKQSLKTINELDELITAGFRGQESQFVEQLINELDQIENDTDDIQRELRAELLKIEGELPAVDVIFIYRIIDLMGGIADTAQRVGDRIELMVAR